MSDAEARAQKALDEIRSHNAFIIRQGGCPAPVIDRLVAAMEGLLEENQKQARLLALASPPPFPPEIQVSRIQAMALGWDAAIASMRYEDGTAVEIVSTTNPYRQVLEGAESIERMNARRRTEGASQ